MKPKDYAENRLKLLAPHGKQRLRDYSKRIAADSKDVYFDKGLLEFISQHFKDPAKVERYRNHLRRVGYASSIKEARQLKVQLDKFMEPNHRNGTTNPNFRLAASMIEKELSQFKVNMMQYGSGDHASYLSVTDTHAGFLFLETGKRKKNEYNSEEIALFYNDYLDEVRKYSTGSLPIMISYRTQGSGGFDSDGNLIDEVKHKTRLVSMKDFREILLEMQFALPFQEKFQQLSWYAGGKSDVQIGQALIRDRNVKGNWVSIDYSSYDQTVSDWLIGEAFRLVKSSFVQDESFDEVLWNAMVQDFVCKSFIGLDGTLKHSNKGIPSGSRWTQIIGTIVNRLMILTYLIKEGHDVSQVSMYIMGDDNIIFSVFKIDSVELAKYLKGMFGVEVNASKFAKGSRNDFPHFLSRNWTPEGADRPDWEIIAKLLHPERFRDYSALTIDGREKLTIEDIIFSYCLSFPVAMGRLLKSKSKFIAAYKERGKSRVGDVVFASGLDRVRYINNLRRQIA